MSLTDEPDEVLDLVDADDVVVGTVVREDIETQLLNLPGNVRAANIFMLNSKGQIWAPTRSPLKKTAPGGYDYSAGEHVHAGETYEQAAIRGLQEELGITAAAQNLTYLGKMDCRSLGIPYFNAIFVYHSDDVPAYSTSDFASYEWLDPSELLARLRNGAPSKRELPQAVEFLINTQKER